MHRCRRRDGRAVGLAAVLLSVLGCGSRTGLDRAPDGGALGAADAGTPAVLLCHWSVSPAVTVATGTRAEGRVKGAVHPSRPEAAVFAQGEDRARGGIVTLGTPVERRPGKGRIDAPLDALGTWAEGYVSVTSRRDRCLVRWRDAELAIVDRTRTSLPAPCILEQTRPTEITLTSSAADHLRIAALSATDPADAPLWSTRVLRPADRARTLRLPDGGALAFAVDAETMHVLALANDGRLRDRHTLHVEDGRFDVSAMPGPFTALLLRQGPRHWRLERVNADASVELVRRFDGGGSEPWGRFVTNETEALVPLRSGAILLVRPATGRPDRLDPVTSREPSALRLVLRPGGSAGGVLYRERMAAGGPRLRFRPLVCAR